MIMVMIIVIVTIMMIIVLMLILMVNYGNFYYISYYIYIDSIAYRI